MADSTDVMYARIAATHAAEDVQNYGSSIEDGRTSDAALAVLLAAGAVAAELRALGITLEYIKDAS